MGAEGHSKQSKRGKNQFVSGIMGISYSPFWNAETGVAYKIFKTADVLNFWTDKLIEIDVLEEKKPKLGVGFFVNNKRWKQETRKTSWSRTLACCGKCSCHRVALTLKRVRIKGGSKRREKRPGQEHWRIVENAPVIVLPLP